MITFILGVYIIIQNNISWNQETQTMSNKQEQQTWTDRLGINRLTVLSVTLQSVWGICCSLCHVCALWCGVEDKVQGLLWCWRNGNADFQIKKIYYYIKYNILYLYIFNTFIHFYLMSTNMILCYVTFKFNIQRYTTTAKCCYKNVTEKWRLL